MRDVLVAIAVSLAVGLGGRGVFRLIRTVRHTSLVAAAWWAVASQMILTVAWAGMFVRQAFSPGVADQIWYLVAVTSLCPLVAVLGARRGRLLDWSLFILLPLIAVLEWIAVAEWPRDGTWRRLELEGPSLGLYGLVLMMGAGNFLGTRFTWAAVWWAMSCGWIVWTLSLACGASDLERQAARACVVVFHLLFWCSVEIAVRRKSTATGWDRVWLDFQNHFGLVWSFRLMPRINEVAQREQWPWRLTADGLQPIASDNTPADDPSADPKVDHTLRWLLKQFVDAEWIDARLSSTDHKQLTADSPSNPACPCEPSPTQSRDHDALH